MLPHENCPRFPSWAECSLRYNIADSECEPGELVHRSEPDVPTIDDEELGELMSLVAPVIEKYNRRYGFRDEFGQKDLYFHIAEQFRSDRMTKVAAYGKAEYTVEFILDLQEQLKARKGIGSRIGIPPRTRSWKRSKGTFYVIAAE